MNGFPTTPLKLAAWVTLLLPSLAGAQEQRFSWNISPPLVSPSERSDDRCFSVKDPSIVFFDGRWYLFCTIRSEKRLRQIEYRAFADWKDADKATARVLPLTDNDCAAPQVFYCTPHKKWYLIYQVVDNKRRPNHYPVYSTSTNIADPKSWSKPVELFAEHPKNVKEWIDFWVICDSTSAHLFFTSLDGRLWRSETALDRFPAGWSRPAVVLEGDVFEASHTYRLKGQERYLTLIEALDGKDSATCRRYYKAYLADHLDGPWKPLAARKEQPFAGPANIKQTGAAWTDSFSHGELLRLGHDEKLEVDPAKLRFLFQGVSDEARRGKKYGEIPWRLGILEATAVPAELLKPAGIDPEFFIKPTDVNRRLLRAEGERRLAFERHTGKYEAWREQAKEKLAELLHVSQPKPCVVKEVRETCFQGVTIKALVMQVNDDLSIPAYLLVPEAVKMPGSAVMAIHGHGDIEPCLGERDDYNHMFALKLAQAGHLVLCPEVRGFGVLNDMAADREGHRLDYWNRAKRVNDRQFTLVTDALIKGETLIGETVMDLLRWEDYLARKHDIKNVRVAGISYGGDLALVYPVFSSRVERIFASGTFGSFAPIFSRCYNAPAHVIPNVLRWLDRADIAGLNAPRPIALHFGERDTPSKDNYSASYNETVPEALRQLKKIYAAAGAEEKVQLIVSVGKGHEMDVEALLAFMKRK
jgi:dienelactone hydrolase